MTKQRRDKTERIFQFIRGYISSNEEAPTLAEIGRQFGMRSTASVHAFLLQMENMGLIERTRSWRGITIK